MLVVVGPGQRLRRTGTKNYYTCPPHWNRAWEWGHEAHVVQREGPGLVVQLPHHNDATQLCLIVT